MANLHTVQLPADRAEWPDELRELFEERAAILEFDGGLERSDADRQAEEYVRTEYGK